MKKISTIAAFIFKELIRKKDFYVFLILLLAVLFFLLNQSFFGENDASRYLKDIGYSLILLFAIIISVSFTAKQLPSEINSKTIYPLLVKPVTRTQVMMGKLLGSIFISVISFSVFFIVFMIFSTLKGEGASGILFLQSYIFSIYLLILLCSISFFFSTFLTVSANITLTILLYFLIPYYTDTLGAIILSTKGLYHSICNIIFYLLPHFEFYNLKIRLVHLWEPLPLKIILEVTLYTFFYATTLFLAACAVFKKKQF